MGRYAFRLEQAVAFMRNTTVMDLFVGIANTQPGYQVRMDGGVINVVSSAIPYDQNFLNVNVKSFRVQNEVVQMAERELRDIVMMKVAPPKSGGILGSLATSPDEPNITFQRDHSSVRENLDGLVNVSRKKIWVVTFVDSFIPTATGFHRTQTLWNNNAVSESEQPVWNMFSWDEPLPSVGLNAYQH
jgi:hypothetical protein